MKHLLYAILVTLIAGSGAYVTAIPPSAPAPPAVKPVPPSPATGASAKSTAHSSTLASRPVGSNQAG